MKAEKRTSRQPFLKAIVMKKFTLRAVIGIFLLGLVSLQTTLAQNNEVGRMNHLNQNDPFEFVERGIAFYVFVDGTFDFNTQPNQITSTTYVMRRGNTAQGQVAQTNGVRVDRDQFGRIRRIGNTFINYDAQNRVNRIGSIFMEYNRKGLSQIGGLQIFYNRNGAIVRTQGCIQPTVVYNNYQSGNYYYGPAIPHNNNVSYVYRSDGTRNYTR